MAKISISYDNFDIDLPVNGKYIWKEQPYRLEFVSNNPNIDKQDKRRKAKGHDGKSDRIASGGQRSGMGRGRGGTKMTTTAKTVGKKDQNEPTVVTLEVIKNVALARMSEVHRDAIPINFSSLSRREQFDVFLLHLLSYFNCFFKKLALETKKNPMYIEPSLSEKQEYAQSIERITLAQKLLGRSYCVLVLGLGCEHQHHMECGRSRVSKTYADRSLYEFFYSFCTYVVWVTFRRKEFEKIKKEIGRILRSDTFNPAIRVKYFTPDNQDQEESTTNETGIEKVQPNPEMKLTPAEYRRLHTKRPAIKSIINQRSPAIVSIIPSPREEASWLFKKPQFNPEDGSIMPADQEELDADNKYSDLFINTKTFKTGILGEPYKCFNPQTLSPIGAENEEDNVDNKEEKTNEDTAAENTTNSDRGNSKPQTAISQVTTEAFTDDEG